MVEHVRIGIVDIGSNAIRFLIAETNGREHRTLESHRFPARLGQHVFQSGRIPESTIAATVDTFRKFRQSCEQLGVRRTRAIATAAMRAAKNGDELIARVHDASQFVIEVISGEQEAQLLQLGVATRIDLSHGRSLLVDVGGGSVEVVVIDNGKVTNADSHPLGALRLLEQFRDADPQEFTGLVQAHLQQQLQIPLGSGMDRYVAVGGNIEFLTDLIQGEPNSGSCAVADLEDQIASIAALTIGERTKQRNLRPDRADVIVPAGLIYLHVAKLAKASSVLVPRTGVKEGLIAETSGLNEQPRASAAEVTFGSCRALGEQHQYEAGHAESVRRLAAQLFEQTRELHHLDDRASVLLQAAALLHDLGRSISYESHHKHAQYLIEASAIEGLDHHERHLVAVVARYHRKALPARDHEDFAALRGRDQTLVEQLAALLRLADALDWQHAQVVGDVAATVRDQEFELRASLAAPNTQLRLEAEAITSKGDLFEQVFGYKPRLVTP